MSIEAPDFSWVEGRAGDSPEEPEFDFVDSAEIEQTSGTPEEIPDIPSNIELGEE